MATENERKWILYNNNEVVSQIKELQDKSYYLRQGYLIGTTMKQVRIRESVSSNGKTKHVMTVKFKTKSRVIEIESKIDSRDFNDLSKLVTSWLTKTRYIIFHDCNKWEIDLFYNKTTDDIYFIMAELELPEDIKYPSSIPEFISDNLLYEVPDHNNSTFSSRKIGDKDYAKKTYEHLLELKSESK